MADDSIREPAEETLYRLLRERRTSSPPDFEPTRRVEDLSRRLEDFTRRVEFKRGDVVRWKPNLRNKKIPRYDEPAIVVEVLANPIESTEDESGSAYFKEPLDLVLAVIDDDADFVLFHYDRRRFEHYEKKLQRIP